MSRRSKILLISGGAAVVVIGLVVFGAWWFFFRDDSPPPPSLETAVESVQESQQEPTAEITEVTEDPTPTPASEDAVEATPTAESDSAEASLDGTWTVDTSIGSFDDFSSSYVGYRVQEELASIGATSAVGRTPVVLGTLVLDGTTITEVTVEADLTELESDDSRRDGQMRSQALETNTFPTATFVLTQPIELDEIPAEGVAIEATAVGDLTIHGVTNSVEVPLSAQLVGDIIVVTGAIDVVFADYDIDAPTSFAVLSVEDEGEMELQLFFTMG